MADVRLKIEPDTEALEITLLIIADGLHDIAHRLRQEREKREQ